MLVTTGLPAFYRPSRKGTKPFQNGCKHFFNINMTSDHYGGVFRRIPGTVKLHQISIDQVLDVLQKANYWCPIWGVWKQGAIKGLIQLAIWVVVDAPLALVYHDIKLVLHLFWGQNQPCHPVSFKLGHQVQLTNWQALKIARVIIASHRVILATNLL